MWSRYLELINWYIVRFLDEIHFGLGQGKLIIIRRLGERYYVNCIQEVEENDPKQKTKKRRIYI
jgi:hypothetical protein